MCKCCLYCTDVPQFRWTCVDVMVWCQKILNLHCTCSTTVTFTKSKTKCTTKFVLNKYKNYWSNPGLLPNNNDICLCQYLTICV